MFNPVHVVKYKLYCPSHFKVFVADIQNSRVPAHENDKHIKATINWICYAQDVTKDGGVSAGYSFRNGWSSSYPETTGYIIPTIFDFYHLTGIDAYKVRALRMSDWLVTIQNKDGSFQGGLIDQRCKPTVFNTGQIIFGLVRSFYETSNEIYKHAAIKAGDWLSRIQDADGTWSQYTHAGLPRAYHTRVAWALIELYNLTSDEKFRNCVKKNINWALENQLDNGFFLNNTITDEPYPYTHTIAYAIRGMLESGILFSNQDYIQSAKTAADALLSRFQVDRYLFGAYNEKWKSRALYSCLTGTAQISITWGRLFEITGDMAYINGMKELNTYLKTTQITRHHDPGISGGIKGSQPIWGNYMPYCYPNWAAKFFIDALLLECKIDRKIKEVI